MKKIIDAMDKGIGMLEKIVLFGSIMASPKMIPGTIPAQNMVPTEHPASVA